MKFERKDAGIIIIAAPLLSHVCLSLISTLLRMMWDCIKDIADIC